MKSLVVGAWVVAGVVACGDNRVIAPSTEIVDIEVTPMALTPAFSPEIRDYTVACAEGDNAVDVIVTDGTGEQHLPMTLVEDQLFDVRGEYFIRCLPHDFPAITTTRFPAFGEPTAGWYLLGSGPYAMVLDTNGTPLWYRRFTNVFDVDSPEPDTISLIPTAGTG